MPLENHDHIKYGHFYGVIVFATCKFDAAFLIQNNRRLSNSLFFLRYTLTFYLIDNNNSAWYLNVKLSKKQICLKCLFMFFLSTKNIV